MNPDRRKICQGVLLGLVVPNVLLGCFRSNAMRREDHATAPSMAGLGPVFTMVGVHMNREMDGAEGWNGGVAWNAYMWNKAGKLEKLLALSLGEVDMDDCMKRMMIAVPGTIEQNRGSIIGVLNHSGVTIYDHDGNSRPVKTSWFGEIDRTDLSGFLKPIEELDHVSEIRAETPEFRKLQDFYLSFRIYDLEIAREYIYKKYGSTLSQKEIERISFEDSLVMGFIDWLKKDWYAFFSMPLMGLSEMGWTAGATKLMSFPSLCTPYFDKPGYSEYLPSAIDVAKIDFRILEEYGLCLIKRRAGSLPRP
jgi:hypothetical protein